MSTIDIEVIAAVVQAVRDLNKVTETVETQSKFVKAWNKTNSDASSALSTLGINLGALNNPLATGAELLKQSVGYTLNYADSIDQLARVTGTGAKEASILATVMGDLGVDTGTLERAARQLKEKGLTPSLETLKKLSVEYRAIQDPAKKNEFLFDNLGRAGLEMADALDRDVTEFDALGRAAMTSGKILDEAMIQRMEEAQIKTQQYADKLDGLKIAVGTFAVDGLGRAVTGGEDYIKMWAAIAIKTGQATGILDDATSSIWAAELAGLSHEEALRQVYAAEMDVMDASDRMASSVDIATEAVGESEEALKLNADAIGRLNDLMAGAVGKEMGAYGDKTVELKDKQADLLAEIKKYEDQQGKTITITDEATVSESELALAGIRAEDAAIRLTQAQKDLSENTDPDKQRDLQTAVLEAKVAVDGAAERVENLGGKMGGSRDVTLDYTGKLTDLRGQLADVNVALGESAAAHEDQTRRILFGILQQQLAVDGFTTDELLALNTVAEKWGLVDSQTAEATEGIIASVAKAHETGNWEALYGDLDGVDRRLRGLPPLVEIEIHTRYTSTGTPSAAAGEVGIGPTAPIPSGTESTPNGGRFQHGGSFIIPPGYNENFPIGGGGASSGERVTVTPAGGGGGAEYQMMLLQMEGRMTRAFRDALLLARG